MRELVGKLAISAERFYSQILHNILQLAESSEELLKKATFELNIFETLYKVLEKAVELDISVLIATLQLVKLAL